MHRFLLYICFVSSLFGNITYLSPAGVGLYVEAGYAPVWRSCLLGDPIVWTVSHGSTVDLGVSTLDQGLFHPNQGLTKIEAPGLRVRADLSANRWGSVEGIYQGLYEWEFNKTVVHGRDWIGTSISPFAQGPYLLSYDFMSFAHIDVEYHEQFNSVELNYLKHLSPRYYDYFSVSVILGLRGIQSENSMNLTGPMEGDGAVNPSLDPIGTLYLKNKNRFIGAQIGGVIRYRITKKLYFECPVKGAILGDILDYQIKIFYSEESATPHQPRNTTPYQNMDRVKAAVGYAAEATPKFELHLGNIYVFAGGNLLYVHGVSPTSIQITQNNLLNVSTCGCIFLGSALVGLGLHL